MVTTVYLIRHAESEGNAQEFFQGNLDTPLTVKGEKQLEYLTERFRDVKLDAIYYSPYRRTELTAEAVNSRHHLKMIPEYDLRELNGGDWEGRRVADLPYDYPAEYRTWCTDMPRFAAPNGDTMQEVYDRICNIITKIAKENPGKTVAVVSHGCALRNFLSFVGSGSIEGLGEVGWSDNTAVSCAEYDTETGWKLIFKNDSAHLPEELGTRRNSLWTKAERAAKEAKK